VWVSYLSAVSPEWKEKVGIGTSVRFPTGTGARGNEGVAGTVRNVRGAIGYVENAYATSNRLVSTQLRNKAGSFVTPTQEAFLAAAENADWTAANFAANLVLADRVPDLHHHPQEPDRRREGPQRHAVLRLGLQERRRPRARARVHPAPRLGEGRRQDRLGPRGNGQRPAGLDRPLI
jgi:ABC-type phosphate transport system substrate-binding protein